MSASARWTLLPAVVAAHLLVVTARASRCHEERSGAAPDDAGAAPLPDPVGLDLVATQAPEPAEVHPDALAGGTGAQEHRSESIGRDDGPQDGSSGLRERGARCTRSIIAQLQAEATQHSGLVSCFDVVLERVRQLVRAGLDHEQGGLRLPTWHTRRGVLQTSALEAVEACSRVQDPALVVDELSGPAAEALRRCLPVIADIVLAYRGPPDATDGERFNASESLSASTLVAMSFADPMHLWELCLRGRHRSRYCIALTMSNSFVDASALYGAHELMRESCADTTATPCLQIEHALSRFCAHSTPFAWRDGPSVRLWAATCSGDVWELALAPDPVAVESPRCRDGGLLRDLRKLRAAPLVPEVAAWVECVASMVRFLARAGTALLTRAVVYLMEFDAYVASPLLRSAEATLRDDRVKFPSCDMAPSSKALAEGKVDGGVLGEFLGLRACFFDAKVAWQTAMVPVGSWRRSDVVRGMAAISEVLPTFAQKVRLAGRKFDPGLLRWMCSTQRPGTCFELLTSTTERVTPPLAHLAISTLMVSFRVWCKREAPAQQAELCLRFVQEVTSRCHQKAPFAETYASDCRNWLATIAPQPVPFLTNKLLSKIAAV